MKSINFILAAAAMVAAAGCAKEMTETPAAVKQVPATISTTTEKTSLDGLDILWSEGDKITVFDSAKKAYTFTLSAGQGTKNGTFSGSIDDGATLTYAIYPANDNAAVTQNKNSYYTSTKATINVISNLVIPEVQEVDGVAMANGANPTIGIIGGTEGSWTVTMKNIGQLFQIVVPESMSNISEIIIASTGSSLSGTFDVDIDRLAADGPVVTSTAFSQEVSIKKTGNSALAAGTYSIVALPSLNGNEPNSSRRAQTNLILTLKNTSGEFAHLTVSGATTTNASEAHKIDLSKAELKWFTRKTVTCSLSSAPSALSGCTSAATRLNDNFIIDVDGYKFKFKGGEETVGSTLNYVGWYYSSSTLNFNTRTTATGSTSPASSSCAKVEIYLPEDSDGYKVFNVTFYTKSNNKALSLKGLITGADGTSLSANSRCMQPANPMPVTLFNKKDAANCYLSLSNSGSFNFSKSITVNYEKPVDWTLGTEDLSGSDPYVF